MTQEAATVEISSEEYAALQRIKDELHALKASAPALCAHVCQHGHKEIVIDPAVREKQRKEAEALDKADKEKRLIAESHRLDSLIKAGRISRDQKERIMHQERERLGLN